MIKTFWNINQAILGWILSALLWLSPEIFIIPVFFSFVSLFFSHLFIYLFNDSVEIPVCGAWFNFLTYPEFTHAMEKLL